MRRPEGGEQAEAEAAPQAAPYNGDAEERAEPRERRRAAREEQSERAAVEGLRRHVRRPAARHLVHSPHRAEAREEGGHARVDGHRLGERRAEAVEAGRMRPAVQANRHERVVVPVGELTP